jgi:NIPSNAP protein
MIGRRSLLSWLGVSVAGALEARSDNDSRPNTPGVIVLESLSVAEAEQMPRLHTYLGGALLPLLNADVRQPAICLEAVVAPKAPQAMVVAGFSSFEEMLASRGRVAAHPRIQNMRAELESAGVFTEVHSEVLIGSRTHCQISDLREGGIFEMRSYHCGAWQAEPPAAVAGVFDRAGIHPIVNAAYAAGEHIPQFTYLIPFASLAAREEAWARVSADADWAGIERGAASQGFSIKVTAKSIYKLAPDSRLA